MAIFSILKNRQEAGQKLARILEDFKGEPAVAKVMASEGAIVLALPRGGVVVGAEIAKALNLPLDIIVTRKIGSPESEEYAIGAIDVDGDGVWNEGELKRVNKEWLNKEIEKEKQEAKRRQNLYRSSRGQFNLKDKIAIIVDDGIATGLTMKAAIRYVKKFNPSKIIIVTPVITEEAATDLEKENVEVRFLDKPQFFFAIGQFYENFPQVSDDEVIRILKIK